MSVSASSLELLFGVPANFLTAEVIRGFARFFPKIFLTNHRRLRDLIRARVVFTVKNVQAARTTGSFFF